MRALRPIASSGPQALLSGPLLSGPLLSGPRALLLPLPLALLLLLALAGGSGCTSNLLSLSALPSAPIALTYWEPEPARRRAELLEKQSQQRQQGRRGVAKVQSIGKLLGVAAPEALLAQLPGRLALLDPQTLEITVIRGAPPGAVPLDWSNDHERLLFLSNMRGPIQIYEYRLKTGEVRAVTHGKIQHLWAAYGRKAQVALLQVFQPRNASPYSRILVSDEKGLNRRVVLDRSLAENMRLSPDGKQMIYVQHPNGGAGRGPRAPVVHSVDLATGEDRRLATGQEAGFSPIGDWIVYSARSRGRWSLRRMRPDGSARVSLGAGIRDEKQPSISPDGKFIAYVGETGGVERLFVRRIDGTGDRILLDQGSAFSPIW